MCAASSLLMITDGRPPPHTTSRGSSSSSVISSEVWLSERFESVMVKPEGEECVVPRARVGLWLAPAALAAIAALAVCMACLDTRYRHQLTDLRDQVDSLKQLVEHMRRQLDLHEVAINSTLSVSHNLYAPARPPSPSLNLKH